MPTILNDELIVSKSRKFADHAIWYLEEFRSRMDQNPLEFFPHEPHIHNKLRCDYDRNFKNGEQVYVIEAMREQLAGNTDFHNLWKEVSEIFKQSKFATMVSGVLDGKTTEEILGAERETERKAERELVGFVRA